jgi:hypothetical protein
MTTTEGPTINFAGDKAYVGAQGQYVTVNDGIHINRTQTSEEIYDEGIGYLLRGNAEQARTRIRQAMARGYETNEVLFHWLLAMLSGRTLREFSDEERRELEKMRPRYIAVTGDSWAPCVQILAGLLDLALPDLAASDKCGPSADLSTLKARIDALPLDQQDLIRPHLELFLTGQEQNDLWESEVRRAGQLQFDGNRKDRVWMYYHPDPKPLRLPEPAEPRVTPADRRRMHITGILFAVAFGFFGAELLWHGAVSGAFAFVVAGSGAITAAEADLRRRLVPIRHRAEQPGALLHTSAAADPKLVRDVQKLFDTCLERYEEDTTVRKQFKTDFAERLSAERSEIISLCLEAGASAHQACWLIRHRCRQLLQRWRQSGWQRWSSAPHPGPLTAVADATGVTLAILGCGWAVYGMRVDPATDAIGLAAVLLTGLLAWRSWLPIPQERERFRVESRRHEERQQDIDAALAPWAQRLLDGRPTDKDMFTWQAADRIMLLHKALTQFELRRSRLVLHAFLEERSPFSRTGHTEDGQGYFAENYQVLIFLLVKEGLRMAKSRLNFVTGSASIRERRDFRYDSIVAVTVTPSGSGRDNFTLQLISGEPIALTARGRDPLVASSPDSADTTENEAPLQAAPTDSALRMLEGIAAEGQSWLKGRTWSQT